jgi:hypothetical protein
VRDSALPARVVGGLLGLLSAMASVCLGAFGMAVGAGVARALVGTRAATDVGAYLGAAAGALVGALTLALLFYRHDTRAAFVRAVVVPLLALIAGVASGLSPLSIGDPWLSGMAAWAGVAVLSGAALLAPTRRDDEDDA